MKSRWRGSTAEVAEGTEKTLTRSLLEAGDVFRHLRLVASASSVVDLAFLSAAAYFRRRLMV
jgi:hypothetical protein